MAADATSANLAPSQALPVFASQYANADRHSRSHAKVPTLMGDVQQDPQTPPTQHAESQGDRPRTELATLSQDHTESPKTDSECNMQAVRSEAARVAAKFVSTHGSAEVVLRFDFMDNRDTRVLCKSASDSLPQSICMFC